ncbi:unnamed protein product [Orchesella dallaii]|uniref:Uncharacterized protein n=1 Tax=Orchesella dallaii TaxID=48710 RepID=A0ABP1Q1E8_9HEXA
MGFDTVALVIVPLQTLMSLFLIFCNVLIISRWDAMAITSKIFFGFWAPMGPIITAFLLGQCARVHSISHGALKSMKQRRNWGNRKENKLMIQFVESCKPMSIGYGIRKSSIVNFFKLIARGTFKALKLIN